MTFEGRYHCKQGQEISLGRLCDFTPDCAHGDDEGEPCREYYSHGVLQVRWHIERVQTVEGREQEISNEHVMGHPYEQRDLAAVDAAALYEAQIVTHTFRGEIYYRFHL